MKKVMISQRMMGVSDDQIQKNREDLINTIKTDIFPDEEVVIVDSYFEENPDSTIPNKAVWYLGKSITKLAEADTLVVEAGAEYARGCKIEISVAKAYGIDVYLLSETSKESIRRMRAQELNRRMKDWLK